MDNEEIRKLLQELKETSDTGTAVRSKVVKIHFDTPEEAEKKARAKRRAEEEATRRRLEEEARAQAAEEARKREAEKAARSAVEEAKLQAQKEFSADLEQDLLKEEPEAQEPEQEAEGLELNWDFEKRRRPGDLLRTLEEEPQETEGEGEDAKAPGQETAPTPDDLSESEEDPSEQESSSAKLKEAALSAFGGAAAGLKKLGQSWRGSIREDLDRMKKKSGAEAGLGDTGEEEPYQTDPDEEWKLAMEQPPRRNLRKRPIPDKPVIALEAEEGQASGQEKELPGAQESSPEKTGAQEPSLEEDDFSISPDEFPNRTLEVVDLDESVHSKEVEEVISLDAPEQAEKSEKKDGQFTRLIGQLTDFVAEHKKQVGIAVGVLAAVIVLIAVLAAALPRVKKARHARITKDDGLNVQVLEQPSAYTSEGDVKLRLKAPETIQSVTVNGQNVAIENGRDVELSYHAQGGTLELMVVSTDKVRSARVTLAYVDSQAPTVTVTAQDGKVSLSAEDEESGLQALYVGSFSGISEIPQYEEYTEPLDQDPEQKVSYYAVDNAGNSSVPVTIALTPATAISFERERFGLFPGTETEIHLVTSPEGAFVNDLTLESQDAHVAAVEGGTILRGIGEGDTKLTASASGLKSVTASVSVAASRTVTLSAIGDCTLGTDVNFSPATSFDAYQAMYGSGYFFEKVRSILSGDDLTFANLEGALTESDQRANKQFAFKGDPSYTDILKEGSVEAVNLANNHSGDYGQAGLDDTQKALEQADIDWCSGDDIAYRDVNGALVAMIGIYALDNGVTKLDQVRSTVTEAQEKGADLIVVEFHWGNELVAEVDDYQKTLAHAAVDAGADLVLGSHAHVLQGIEKYNGSYIVYGLSNFCFGGNSTPASYDSMIFRQTFTFTREGLESEDDIVIIPCRISSDSTINNFQPVPVTGEQAQTIMDRLDELSEPFGISASSYMADGTQMG